MHFAAVLLLFLRRESFCKGLEVSLSSRVMSDLAVALGGSGRAKSVWNEMRQGIEPLSLESSISFRTREALEIMQKKKICSSHYRESECS